MYTGLLVPIIYDTLPLEYESNVSFELSMFAMVSLGIGEILGGILMGIIIDKIGPKRSAFINVSLVLI